MCSAVTSPVARASAAAGWSSRKLEVPARWNQYSAIPSPDRDTTASAVGSVTGTGSTRTSDWAS